MQINIRCFSCHTPFSVKQEEIEAALTLVTQENLKHYNAVCPRCGKSNTISKNQLRRAAPKWEPPKPAKKKKASEEAK
jgi:ribosomal protein S27AE